MLQRLRQAAPLTLESLNNPQENRQQLQTLRPGVRQDTALKDGNTGKYLAKGLYQFRIDTFRGWSIPGFTNIRNPVHQIAAAVNVQVNHWKRWFIAPATMGWGPGECPKWGPGNPYRNGLCRP